MTRKLLLYVLFHGWLSQHLLVLSFTQDDLNPDTPRTPSDPPKTPRGEEGKEDEKKEDPEKKPEEEAEKVEKEVAEVKENGDAKEASERIDDGKEDVCRFCERFTGEKREALKTSVWKLSPETKLALIFQDKPEETEEKPKEKEEKMETDQEEKKTNGEAEEPSAEKTEEKKETAETAKEEPMENNDTEKKVENGDDKSEEKEETKDTTADKDDKDKEKVKENGEEVKTDLKEEVKEEAKEEKKEDVKKEEEKKKDDMLPQKFMFNIADGESRDFDQSFIFQLICWCKLSAPVAARRGAFVKTSLLRMRRWLHGAAHAVAERAARPGAAARVRGLAPQTRLLAPRRHRQVSHSGVFHNGPLPHFSVLWCESPRWVGTFVRVPCIGTSTLSLFVRRNILDPLSQSKMCRFGDWYLGREASC